MFLLTEFIDRAQIVQIGCQVRIVFPQYLLPDRDGAFVESGSLVGFMLGLLQGSQIIQARSDIPMLRTEDSLANLQYPLQKGIRIRKIAARPITQGKVLQGVCIIRMIAPERLAEDTYRLPERILGLQRFSTL